MHAILNTKFSSVCVKMSSSEEGLFSSEEEDILTYFEPEKSFNQLQPINIVKIFGQLLAHVALPWQNNYGI